MTNTEAATDLTIMLYNDNVQFTCYFMAYNNYPLWPDHVAFTETPIASLQVTTAKEDDYASMIAIGTLILALLV